MLRMFIYIRLECLNAILRDRVEKVKFSRPLVRKTNAMRLLRPVTQIVESGLLR